MFCIVEKGKLRKERFKYILAVTNPEWVKYKRIRESDPVQQTVHLVLYPICSSRCLGKSISSGKN